MATNGTPRGCGPQVDPLYFRLCDLDVAWGVAVEAAAAAGAIFCLVLLLALAASVPFVNGGGGVRPARLWLHAAFLLADGGLFGLAFAFVVGRDFATCASRRFLFGVLFAACFSCQLAAAARLLAMGRRHRGNDGGEREPSGVLLLLGALALWLVEVVVNTEWLVLTVARYPPLPPPLANDTAPGNAAPCLVANQDFVMALVYVMALLAGVVAAGLGAVATAGGRGPARREGALILASGLLSGAVWAAWTAMFLHGNAVAGGGPNWDDPTLAIATATNAWVFLAVYAIPLFCAMSGGEEEEEEEEMMDAGGGGGEYGGGGRGGGYDNILKEKGAQNMFMENKAFSMDEPGQGSKPVSPYSGYSGQLRGSVYQPTELALISKAVGNEPSFDMIIPRASAGSAATSGSSTPSSRLQAPPTPQPAGYGLNRSPQW